MLLKFNIITMINTCKTIGCPSFGIKNSKSYRMLDNDEIFCVECGFSFYSLYESEFNKYKLESNKNIYKSIGHCSKCGCKNNLIGYGTSTSKKTRRKCLNCGGVFTSSSGKFDIPDSLKEINDLIFYGDNINDYKKFNKVSAKIIGQKLKKLAILLGKENTFIDKVTYHLNVATEVIFIPYNSSNNTLYVIVSFCIKTGRVLHLTTNYFANAPLIDDMVYSGNTPLRNVSNDLALEISKKENEISSRNKFFDIDYGASMLKKNEVGHIIKPAYAAYRHFDILNRKLSEIKYINHFIEHESFIYASCLSSFKEKVINRSCHIYYLRVGEIINTKSNEKLALKNYWKDTWNISKTNNISYAICNLTSTLNITNPIAPLTQCKFTKYIFEHPFYTQLTKMSAQNVTLLLDIISVNYNKKLQ
ncbi:hypothetical protein J7Y46_004783 [Vibrio parahaemolyticus]|nr:hypothetical protein [Vibrio parahaemolyticus]EIZ1552143.1 hypothetical protein [Vibrio parahaemolyticus]